MYISLSHCDVLKSGPQTQSSSAGYRYMYFADARKAASLVAPSNPTNVIGMCTRRV